MGKKSREKMTDMTFEQRIERSKKNAEEMKLEKAKEIARLVMHKLETDAEAREQLLRAMENKDRKYEE